MAICLKCGESDLLNSDLCGNAGCIYCCGTLDDEDEAKWARASEEAKNRPPAPKVF